MIIGGSGDVCVDGALLTLPCTVCGLKRACFIMCFQRQRRDPASGGGGRSVNFCLGFKWVELFRYLFHFALKNTLGADEGRVGSD